MKTLLVVGQLPSLAQAVEAAVEATRYRVVHRTDLAEAAPLLSHGLAEVCLVDADVAEVQGLWQIEKLRQQFPQVPVIVYCSQQPWAFEEEAYLHGVSHVLVKPVRARLLNAVLDRVLQENAPHPPRPAPAPAAAVMPRPAAPPPAAPPPTLDTVQVRAWQLLRDFSAVLTHSLCAEALMRQFLQFLRENLGINRAAVFLRAPPVVFGQNVAATEREALRCAGAVGLPTGLLDHFQLSLASGTGGFIAKTGRILRKESGEALQDPEILKELEVLGAQVAVPMMDRDALVGVAVFDGHLTGESLSNDELELIYHLLGELGLTIRNIWLHEQLAANHAIVSEILQQLNSACVVVARDLTVLQANKKARTLFQRGTSRPGEFEFSELPQMLGSKVFLALKTGSGVAPFRYHPPERPGAVYSVSITPFYKEEQSQPSAVLLLVDDLTETEQVQRLERENERLQLLREVSARLSHEIGNALVPLSIHQQLLAEKYDQPEFRASLDQALADGVRRIVRLVAQMKLMTRERPEQGESIPLESLLQEASLQAQQHCGIRARQIHLEPLSKPVFVQGDRSALRDALAEVLLNALQANPQSPEVWIRARLESATEGPYVSIEVRDNGAGFAPEALARLHEPFFTTRTAGLGLGLTVCRRVIEGHRGRLEVPVESESPGGCVRIKLPLMTN
ncbi:ATP-binding protein [Fontisphaera persica]|uniref:ATP-binding protein n=1 Tax=Fontisphaera persica TaxID=2974023 RepID=UPI0024BF5CA4|nr:ATP-binding protein [Fontisphaera persica]WCJ58598.1 ATP-binding protein [Fontisphaera persica]